MADPSFTVREWCALRKVSRSLFYKLDAQGLSPRTHYVGVKRLISPEADADWLRQREAAAIGSDSSTWAEQLDEEHPGNQNCQIERSLTIPGG